MIARLMLVNFLTKTKTNIGKLRLSRWKTIQVMKIKKISKLILYQYAEGISVSNSKTVERADRTNRDMKKATTAAKRRSKLQLENGKSISWVNIRFPFIFKLLIILFYSCVYL